MNIDKPSLRFVRNNELLQALDGDTAFPVINKEIISLKNIEDKLYVTAPSFYHRIAY